MKLDIKTHRVVKINLSAMDWQLYSKDGDSHCAVVMNLQLQDLINQQLTREEVYQKFANFRIALSPWGAGDTEPRCVTEDILDEVFGKED